MQINSTFLQNCEDLIAKGKVNAALEKLHAIKDESGYKNDILNLNNRWKKFTRDKMNGMLSNEEQSLLNSRFNNDLLLLLEALRRELNGEKIVSDLFQNKDSNGKKWHPLTQTYIPIALTALAIWAMSFFAYRQPKPVCSQPINLNGNWKVTSDLEVKKIGAAKIIQKECSPLFQVSGALKPSKDAVSEVDFNSKIGSFDDGKIIFVYENFEGEMGVCRGVIPLDNSNEFTMHCTDLIGMNKDDRGKVTLNFKRILK